MGKVVNKLKDTVRSAAIAAGVVEVVDEYGRSVKPCKQRLRRPRRTPYYGPRITPRMPRLR